jgi:uncharacterized protein YcaQ
MNPPTISKRTYRRFLLGQQGLWPGRRFEGVDGAAAAIRQMEALQLDPLNIAARSQEIALYGRVLDYRLEYLSQTAYEQRRFFDYGGHLFLYPMEDLPYWQTHMRHRREQGLRWESFKHPPGELLKYILGELRERGPLGNRDFEGKAVEQWSYRGRKETSIALFYLWLIGDVMISNRKGFDRIYDLTERVAPREFSHAASESDAEEFFGRKAISFAGMLRENTWKNAFADYLHREVLREEARERVEQLIETGVASQVRVEGSKDGFLILTRDTPHLSELEAGRVPQAWQPLGPSTDEEVTLLAPLEIVSARGRAQKVFDFEYLWEVYKPVHQRRWGYYTLPILYGDDLVARLDPKLDRKTMTLYILGFWLEEDAPRDASFADALARGLNRFAKLVGARALDVSTIRPVKLRNHVKSNLKTLLKVQ